MWRKPEESNPQSSPDSSSSPVSSPQSPVAAAPPVFPNAPACLGRTITIKGEISGQDDLFLDGTFEGKTHIAEGSFTAGPNARVNAEIDAREIIVRGEVIAEPSKALAPIPAGTRPPNQFGALDQLPWKVNGTWWPK